MDTYASLSPNSICPTSYANRVVFPALCNAAGYTDVDQYCNDGLADLCCGLCINTSVAGVGQFVWAVFVYGLGMVSYLISPDGVWGLVVFEYLNASVFAVVGLASIWSGGAMTRWHTKFLWPQAFGLLAVVTPGVFAPLYNRLGTSYWKIRAERAQFGSTVTIALIRSREHELDKAHMRLWHYSSAGISFIFLALFTGLWGWVIVADDSYFSQTNCDDVDFGASISPDLVTYILVPLAWVVLGLDCVVCWKRRGISELIVERVWPKLDNFDAYRKKERMITVSVSLFVYLLWFSLNLWLFWDGQNKYLLSGSDQWTFGQVEQLTALFPTVLGFFYAITSWLTDRDNCEQAVAKSKLHHALTTDKHQLVHHDSAVRHLEGPRRPAQRQQHFLTPSRTPLVRTESRHSYHGPHPLSPENEREHAPEHDREHAREREHERGHERNPHSLGKRESARRREGRESGRSRKARRGGGGEDDEEEGLLR